MVHNAMSSSKNLFAGYNNLEPLEQALVNGYRGLMLDSCICDGSLGETVQGFLKGEEDKVCPLFVVLLCAYLVYFSHLSIFNATKHYRVRTIMAFVIAAVTQE